MCVYSFRRKRKEKVVGKARGGVSKRENHLNGAILFIFSGQERGGLFDLVK